MHSQFCNFSHPRLNKASSNCLSDGNPAYGRLSRFRSRRTTGASILPMILAICIVEDVSKRLDIHMFRILSNLGASSNFTWVYADTASAACPSLPGNLAITSMIFAAVIWDADEPCSVKTACPKLPELQNRLLQRLLWVCGSAFYISAILVLAPNFLRWMHL